jgi:hypothetical protein
VYRGCGKEKSGVLLLRCGACGKIVRQLLCRLQKTRMKSVEKQPSYEEKNERCNAYKNMNCIALFIDIARKLKKLNKSVKLTEFDGV